MDDARLSVFLSSRTQELHDERVFLNQVLEHKGMQVFVFESDAGARPEAPKIAYLNEVASADIYVALFWNDFSEPVLEEFECARSLGKPCFIYVKTFAVKRDGQLIQVLNDISDGRSGLTVAEFSDVLQLGKLVSRDLQNWLIRDWRAKCDMPGAIRHRLIRDADDMLNDDIEIVRLENWPPTFPTFHLRFRIKGVLGLDPSDEPVFGDDHRLRMELHKDYPMSLPFTRFTTPLFHPNVFEEGGVCMGWFELPYKLSDVCVHIAKMIDYQIYYRGGASFSCEPARLRLGAG
jgi:ubiquitin-protein ligase